MKQFYIIGLMAATILSASAIALEKSTKTKNATVFKSINTESHLKSAIEVSPVKALAPAKEAPANLKTLPATFNLTKTDPDLEKYHVIDANGDGKTWTPGSMTTASVCFAPATGVAAMDDWMFMLPVELKAGQNYRLGFKCAAGSSTIKNETMDVYVGQDTTVAAMTQLIYSTPKFGGATLTAYEEDFTVAADGYYYVAFHGTSLGGGKSKNIKLANVTITASAPKVDPPAAGTLTYEVAPQGQLKATLHYTAPTTTVKGAELTSIQKVEVKANTNDTRIIETIAPGETYDLEINLKQGTNTITATAYLEDTPGTAAQVKNVFAGYDEPKPVTNLVATLSEDYKSITLSWDPTEETGVNGGYVLMDSVNYFIFDAFGSYTDPAIASTTNTSITFDASAMTEQDFVAFQVTAGYISDRGDALYSTEVASNIVVPGPAATLPYYESFANSNLSTPWAIVPGSTTSQFQYFGMLDDATLASSGITSRDGDNGYLFLLNKQANSKAGLYSAKIDVRNIDAPVLEFFILGNNHTFELSIASEGGAFQRVGSIDALANPIANWSMVRIPLDAFKDKKYIQLQFNFTFTGKANTTMFAGLDDIRVRNLTADLVMLGLNAPANTVVGENYQVVARIENRSDVPADAIVTFTRNDEVLASVPVFDIPANGIAPVAVADSTWLGDDEYIFYNAVATGEDMVAGNNEAAATTHVLMPINPTVGDLAGSLVGGNTAVLTWNRPDFEPLTQPSVYFEDFENAEYPTLTISDFAGWSMVDADSLNTYKIVSDSNNPYLVKPQAFQLYNPYVAGCPSNYISDFLGHGDGQQMLVAWSAQGQNDNWLISPELPGVAQTISFYACSLTSAGPETIEVYYSTSGKELTDFEQVTCPGTEDVLPETWAEYTFDVPEGTKYFAIRHTSNDSYALFLDDFTFTKGGPLTGVTLNGYNVYRNNAKINEAIVAEETYTDTIADGATHSYRVSAVYSNAESQLSTPVEVAALADGIENVEAAKEAIFFNLQGLRIKEKAVGTPSIRLEGDHASVVF